MSRTSTAPAGQMARVMSLSLITPSASTVDGEMENGGVKRQEIETSPTGSMSPLEVQTLAQTPSGMSPGMTLWQAAKGGNLMSKQRKQSVAASDVFRSSSLPARRQSVSVMENSGQGRFASPARVLAAGVARGDDASSSIASGAEGRSGSPNPSLFFSGRGRKKTIDLADHVQHVASCSAVNPRRIRKVEHWVAG